MWRRGAAVLALGRWALTASASQPDAGHPEGVIAGILANASGAAAASLPRGSAAKGGKLDKKLEQKLRKWWGDDWFWEFQRAVDEDRRDLGYELNPSLDEAVQSTMWKVVTRHESGDPCSSLPLELALHAWRYSPDELDRCLSRDFWNSGAASCALPCRSLQPLGATLSCRGVDGLAGAAPAGRCMWAPDAEPVETTGGLVRGVVRPIPWRHADGQTTFERTRTFWGIPYADKPERFAMARPLSTRWSGEQITDYYSISRNDSLRMHCMGGAPLDRGGGNEDCLFLDVYCPPNASTSSPRPVVALIFAAGFVLGDAWQGGHTDSVRLALRDDVVFVVISSRTAALGHWAHPALTKEYGDGSAGNIGERDQREAFRWIRENIRGFGGDPDKVTLLGHSSGAFDIAFHLASPGSEGLFSGAVLESSTYDSGWYWQSKEDAFAFYEQLGESMGCPRDSEGAPGSQIACLRELPADAFYNSSKAQIDVLEKRLKGISYFTDAWQVLKSILAAETGIGGGYHKAGLQNGDSEILASPLWPILPNGLVVDGSSAGVPAPPRELYEAGRGADVPVYINHEHDEGTIFALLLALAFPWQESATLTHDTLDAILYWVFGSNATFTQELFQLYPRGSGENSPYNRLSNIIRDSVFLCSARRFAAARSRRRPGSVFWAEHTFAGGSLKSHSAVEALLRRDSAYFLGAHHCLPTLQIFGAEYIGFSGWVDIDQRNHELLHCHLARMFHCSDPGAAADAQCRRGAMPLACQGVPEEAAGAFAAFDPSRPRRSQLNPHNGTPIVPSAEEDAICRFWDAAPPMRFSSNSCRGCAGGAAAKAAAKGAVAEQDASVLLV